MSRHRSTVTASRGRLSFIVGVRRVTRKRLSVLLITAIALTACNRYGTPTFSRESNDSRVPIPTVKNLVDHVACELATLLYQHLGDPQTHQSVRDPYQHPFGHDDDSALAIAHLPSSEKSLGAQTDHDDVLWGQLVEQNFIANITLQLQVTNNEGINPSLNFITPLTPYPVPSLSSASPGAYPLAPSQTAFAGTFSLGINGQYDLSQYRTISLNYVVDIGELYRRMGLMDNQMWAEFTTGKKVEVTDLKQNPQGWSRGWDFNCVHEGLLTGDLGVANVFATGLQSINATKYYNIYGSAPSSGSSLAYSPTIHMRDSEAAAAVQQALKSGDTQRAKVALQSLPSNRLNAIIKLDRNNRFSALTPDESDTIIKSFDSSNANDTEAEAAIREGLKTNDTQHLEALLDPLSANRRNALIAADADRRFENLQPGEVQALIKHFRNSAGSVAAPVNTNSRSAPPVVSAGPGPGQAAVQLQSISKQLAEIVVELKNISAHTFASGSPLSSPSGGAPGTAVTFGSIVQFTVTEGINGGPNWNLRHLTTGGGGSGGGGSSSGGGGGKGGSSSSGAAGGSSGGASQGLFNFNRNVVDMIQITAGASCRGDPHGKPTTDPGLDEGGKAFSYWDAIPFCNDPRAAALADAVRLQSQLSVISQ